MSNPVTNVFENIDDNLSIAYQTAFNLDWDQLSIYIHEYTGVKNKIFENCLVWIKIKDGGKYIPIGKLFNHESIEYHFSVILALYYQNISVCEAAYFNCNPLDFVSEIDGIRSSFSYIKISIREMMECLVLFHPVNDLIEYCFAFDYLDEMDWLLRDFYSSIDFGELFDHYHYYKSDSECSEELAKLLECENFYSDMIEKRENYFPKHWKDNSYYEQTVHKYTVSYDKSWDICYRYERIDDEGSHKPEYQSEFVIYNNNTFKTTKILDKKSFYSEGYEKYEIKLLTAGNRLFAYVYPFEGREIVLRDKSNKYQFYKSVQCDDIQQILLSYEDNFLSYRTSTDVVVWDLKEENETLHITGNNLASMQFSWCETFICIVDELEVSVYHTKSGNCLQTFSIEYPCLEISFTDKQIIIVSKDKLYFHTIPIKKDCVRCENGNYCECYISCGMCCVTCILPEKFYSTIRTFTLPTYKQYPWIK